MIAVDLSDERLNLKSLQWHIQEDHAFSHWWNHLPSLFLVETELTSMEITNRLRVWLSDVSFIVMQVDPKSAAGWLPDDAGDWLRRRAGRSKTEAHAVERMQ